MRFSTIAFMMAAIVVIVIFTYGLSNAAMRPQQSQGNYSCDASLWEHVYNPSRLQVIDRCRTVSGTIKVIRKEADGDYHINLELDEQYKGMLNDENVKQQKGYLVIEPVCMHDVTQKDAVAACENYRSDIHVPPIGSHVMVTGAYVLDTQHGWNELHPITSIVPQ